MRFLLLSPSYIVKVRSCPKKSPAFALRFWEVVYVYDRNIFVQTGGQGQEATLHSLKLVADHTKNTKGVLGWGLFFPFYLFISGCAVFSMMCGLPLAAESGGYSVAAGRLLTVAASLVAEHRL